MNNIYDVIAQAMDSLDEKYINKAADSFPVPLKESWRNITINAEDLVEMKKQIKKSNLIAKIAGIAAAFACVATVSVFLIMNNNGVPVLGGSTSDYNESRIENPFSTSEPDNPLKNENLEENLGKDAADIAKKSKGGYTCSTNGVTELSFDGNAIEIPFVVSANGTNPYPVTVGISLYVNGVLQDITTDTYNGSLYITKELSAGEQETVNLKLNPIITESDKDKDKLNIHLVTFFNPDYVPSEKAPSFGNVHNIGWCSLLTLNVEKEIPEFSDAKISSSYKEELLTNEHKANFDISNEETTSVFWGSSEGDSTVLKLNDDGSINYNLAFYDPRPEEKYLVAFFKNNEQISFDDGIDYYLVEARKGYVYTFSPTFKGLKTGDFVYAVAVPAESENIASIRYGAAKLCVSSDYSFGNSETSTTQDNNENEKNESSPEMSIGTELSSFSATYNAGYLYEGDNIYSVIVDSSNNLMVLDIDNKKLIGKTDLSQYNEISANGTDYTKVMLIPDRSFFTDDIILCNLAYSDDGQYSIYSYLIFDKNAKLREEISLKEERFYTSDDKYIAIEYKETEGTLTPFLSMNNGSYFNLPDNYFPRNVKIQNENIIASGYLGCTPAVMVADINGENVKVREFESLDNGRFEFFTSHHFVLWRNISQKSTENYENSNSGTNVLVYDFSKEEFRTMHLEHLSEGRTCILSHDGTKILTHHNASGKCIIREYDIASGKKTNELVSENAFNNPVAIFGRNYVAITSETGSSKAEFIKYR